MTFIFLLMSITVVFLGNIRKGLVKSLRNVLRTLQRSEEYPYQELLLETKVLTVAIWRDENLYYVFDSKPRDKNGRAVNIEQWLEPSEFDVPVVKSQVIIRPQTVVKEESTHEGEEEKLEEKIPNIKSVIIQEDKDGDADVEKETNVINLEPVPEGEPALDYYENQEEEGRWGDE